MQRAYLIILIVTAAAAVGLVAARVAQLARGRRPSLGRSLNEWTWTLIPLLVLGGLLWKVSH